MVTHLLLQSYCVSVNRKKYWSRIQSLPQKSQISTEAHGIAQDAQESLVHWLLLSMKVWICSESCSWCHGCITSDRIKPPALSAPSSATDRACWSAYFTFEKASKEINIDVAMPQGAKLVTERATEETQKGVLPDHVKMLPGVLSTSNV